METVTPVSESQGEAWQASAEAVFSGESVLLPFVPQVFAAAVRPRGPQVFGTRDPQPAVYALEHYVSELEQPGLEDYLLVGFDGHGIASQALHYYLVFGPLALFIQRSHGNPFADRANSRRRINGALELAELLYRDVTQAGRAGKLPPDKRLVVVESDFSRSRWGWVSTGEAAALEENANAFLCGLLCVKELLG